MTPVKYLSNQGLTTADLSTLRRTDPAGFVRLKEMAAEEMRAEGIAVEGDAPAPTE
jgi:hypothetical protein